MQVDIDMPGTRCQLTWWVRLPALAAALAAVALLASGAQAAGVVSIDAGTSVALAVAVRVASRQITTKSNATVHTDDPTASIHLVLSIDPSLGPESFAIADAPAGQMGAAVVGGDSRGVYYGLGRLLRNSTFGASFTPGSWRGRSAPALPNGFRAMYLATHLENFYQAAPLAKVQEYVEDLALWGANTMALVMPWEEFSSFDDPAMVRQINMTTTLFKAAKQTGLGVGLVAAANQGFSSRPERIKACYPLPGNHFGEFNAHMPQVSTVKEGGVAYLLTNFRELFQQYKTNEVDLDFFISWPYDEGGSACTGADGYSEWPWGARGFPNITHQLSVLGKQLFPNMRTVVSTWGFDRPAAVGEFAGLDQYIRSHPGAFDFTMADSNTEFPSWPIEAHHGPGDLPLLNFPEISMWGRTPWGGFGANPLPERFQQLWRPIEKLVSGGMPYSEGIFEDLNQAICFQHYWNASTTANQTVAEYIGFEFSGRPEVITTVSEAITLLEANYPISAHPPCFLPSCGGDSEGSDRCTRALDLLSRAAQSLSQEARTSWRWRILMDRAVIDAGLDATHGQVTGQAVTDALADLVQIYYAQQAYPAVKPPTPVNASVHNCSALPTTVKTCPLDTHRGAFIPWVREPNASNVWGTTSQGTPATPVLGPASSELECREKCAANPNCTQYVWSSHHGELCFGRCDAFWDPHPTDPSYGIVSGRRVAVNASEKRASSP